MAALRTPSAGAIPADRSGLVGRESNDGRCIGVALQMPVSSQQQLMRCLMRYPAEIFGARFVRATQKFVSNRLKDQQQCAHPTTLASLSHLSLR